MSRTTLHHPLVEAYLDDLEQAARRLPRRERQDLLAEIRVHIDERLRETDRSEAAVQQLLEDLGEPRDIAAAAGATTPGGVEPARRRGWLEVSAVILLLIGALLLPVFGWFVGVALLWASTSWATWEKLLGTLVFPGGIAAPLVVGVIAAREAAVFSWLALLMMLVLTVVPLIVATYLLRAAGRPAP